MFKGQTVQMLRVKHIWKTNSKNVVNKTCLKDKQYKCWEENMSKTQTVQMLWCKTCLKDKQYKCCE